MSDSDKKNVLVWGHIHHAGPDLLKGRDDVSLEIVEDVTADIGDRLATLDGIIVRTQRIDAAVLERAPRLAVVARHGVGFDAVDVPALSQRGLPLTTVGEANAHTVAEHALFLMLTLAKQGLTYDAATRGDDWKLRETFSCTELWRKTVLVIGFGRIGSRVSRLCRAFGMDVLVIDPYVPAFRIEYEGHRRIEDMAAALGRADYVTIQIPLNEETRHLVGAAELGAMKSSAFLINTARGPVVDEVALHRALKSGAIKAAGLDVFDTEPPAADNPLFKLDNVVLSPHIAGITSECGARMSLVCAQNVLDAFDGRLKPDHVVNQDVLRRNR